MHADIELHGKQYSHRRTRTHTHTHTHTHAHTHTLEGKQDIENMREGE